MPHVTVVIHGPVDPEFSRHLSIVLHNGLAREEARKVAFVNGTEERPADMIWQAAAQLHEIISHIREDQATQDASATRSDWRAELDGFIRKNAEQIDNSLLRLKIALDAGRAPFIPTDKQVLWAMNVVGVLMTTAGPAFEDLLPAAEFAVFVRKVVSAAQNPDANKYYPDEGSLIEAARARGLADACFGEVIYDGRPLAGAPPELREQAEGLIPEGTTLVGIAGHWSRGLQADYVDANGRRGSSYYNENPHAASVTLPETLK